MVSLDAGLCGGFRFGLCTALTRALPDGRCVGHPFTGLEVYFQTAALHGKQHSSRDTGWLMSEENVEIVRRAVAAVNARDINRYLANCTEDVELRTPFASIGGLTKARMTFGASSTTSRTQRRTFGSASTAWKRSATTKFSPSCTSQRAGERPDSHPC